MKKRYLFETPFLSQLMEPQLTELFIGSRGFPKLVRAFQPALGSDLFPFPRLIVEISLASPGDLNLLEVMG